MAGCTKTSVYMNCNAVSVSIREKYEQVENDSAEGDKIDALRRLIKEEMEKEAKKNKASIKFDLPSIREEPTLELSEDNMAYAEANSSDGSRASFLSGSQIEVHRVASSYPPRFTRCSEKQSDYLFRATCSYVNCHYQGGWEESDQWSYSSYRSYRSVFDELSAGGSCSDYYGTPSGDNYSYNYSNDYNYSDQRPTTSVQMKKITNPLKKMEDFSSTDSK